MSKLYRKKVQARADGSGRPVCFRWRGRWHRVESAAPVRPSLYHREPRRWRVITQGGVFELARDGDGWVLWRVWD